MTRFGFAAPQSHLRGLFSKKCWTAQHLRKSTRCSVIKAVATVATFSAAKRERLTSQPLRVVCIGDIHSQWDINDEKALRKLKPDLALFVGDYGDEDVRVTRQIADMAGEVNFAVATVFGNHDAFFTASYGGQRRAPYDKNKVCRVTEQIEMLKPYDVSYRSVGFDGMPFSVVGGRSFSVGGPHWKYKPFFQKFVGVYSLDHSTQKIVSAVQSVQKESIVFLSHSGPTGLGKNPDDPCGKDWGDEPGGDYGDEDLRRAIEKARKLGKRVPLVVFGHMHKPLHKGSGYRKMLKTEPDGEPGCTTVMLNAAVFPRHDSYGQSGTPLRNFQIVQLMGDGSVDFVDEAWATANGSIFKSERIYSAIDNTQISSATNAERCEAGLS